jgi:demethylspheroidene O-methyltransferase
LAVPEIARRASLPAERADRLVGAAIALRLLERRGGLVGLGPLGAALLGDTGVAAMVRHHALLYADLAEPVALLRGESPTRLAGLWPYATTGDPTTLADGTVAPYSALMTATQPMVAAEILAAYPLRRHRSLLDIGGGEGAFLRAAARAAPNLRLALFDLPAVAERARAALQAAGLHAEVTGGDIRTWQPAPGADVVTLIRVIHDHDEPLAMAFLRAARASLAPGGTLLLAEPMAGVDGVEPVAEAYFGFYLLAMGSGQARTPEKLRTMIAEAGFRSSRVVRTRVPLVTGLIAATAWGDPPSRTRL